jgi:predicted nucleic acid-binding protein
MIVVDTNIIIHLHMTSEWSTHILGILQMDPYWYSPPLWQSEFRNVLSGAMRRNIINLDQARQIMESALETMAGHEIPVSSGRVLELAAVSSCTAYDCEFVALAKELGVKLVTFDKQILARFPETAVEPFEFIKKEIPKKGKL